MRVTVLCTNDRSTKWFSHCFYLINQTSDGLDDNFPKRFICQHIEDTELVEFRAWEIELLAVELPTANDSTGIIEVSLT